MRAFKGTASAIVFWGLGVLAATGCTTRAGEASPENESISEARAADDGNPCGTMGASTATAGGVSQGAPPPDGTTTAPPDGTAIPPQGAAAPPQDTTAPPQDTTAPPQGTTAPPQGTPPVGEPGIGGVGDIGPVGGPIGGPIAPIPPVGGCEVPVGPCGCCPGVCWPAVPSPVLTGYFTGISFCFRW